MDNSLKQKPDYTAHRRFPSTMVADTTNLATLTTEQDQSAINAGGYDSLHGFVSVVGGGNITLQPLEAVKYKDSNGQDQKKFVARGSNIGPLVDGDVFSLSSEGGGRWFLRVHAVGGVVNSGAIYVAAGKRSEEGSI